MTTSPTRSREPIRIPRATSLWLPTGRSALIAVLSFVIALPFALEILKFLSANGAVQRGEGGDVGGLLLAALALWAAAMATLPWVIWDMSEALGPSLSRAGRVLRLVAVALAFAIGAAWAMTNGAPSMPSITESVLAATTRMALYGGAAAIPIAAICGVFRRRRDTPEVI